MKLNGSTLNAIADSIANYFTKQEIGNVMVSPAMVGEPGVLPNLDYSGVISIHGDYSGAIYCTASKTMLKHLLERFNYPVNEEGMLDLIGEMANIFAGSIRKDLGSSFKINAPIKLLGPISKLKFQYSDAPYVLPIYYEDEKALLVICLSKK